TTRGDGLLEEEGSDGRRRWQTCGLKINDLLALRRDDLHRTTIDFENSGQFTQDIALASPGATAKQRDEVARRNQPTQRNCLLGVKRHAQRRNFHDSLLTNTTPRQADNFPFAAQGFFRCRLPRKPLASEILTPVGVRF